MKNIINNRMVSIYVYSKKPSLYSVQGRQGMEKVDLWEKTIAARTLWPSAWIIDSSPPSLHSLASWSSQVLPPHPSLQWH